MFGGADMGHMFPKEETLVINRNHKLVKAVLNLDNDKKEEKELLVKQIYDLAMINHRPLDPEAMAEFVQRSLELMEKVL